MSAFSELPKSSLYELQKDLSKRYDEFKSRNLKLDMSRGKPSPDQLNIINPMMSVLNENSDLTTAKGIDCRNYSLADGIPEMKKIFSDILEVDEKDIIAGGNSSLNMMFDAVSQGMILGFGCGSWMSQGKIKFLCPVPGYDRHFAVCEYFGIEMINIPMTSEGPNMDMVEEYVNNDPLIKGIWCVPKYSNPQGIVYSDATIKRFAGLKPAAKDFRIFWDNSYCIHHLNEKKARILEILSECRKAGNEDIVLEFTSTSKISYPGAGVAALAASEYNRKLLLNRITIQTIGPDKLNQLRHVRYFKNADNINAHMEKMAEKIQPKFDVVLTALKEELGTKGIATWSEPEGGYFISVDVMKGCAEKVVQLCKEAGVILTGAGATYPYGKDPDDSNIRIAPTYPTIGELSQAIELFCISVQLAAVLKLLS